MIRAEKPGKELNRAGLECLNEGLAVAMAIGLSKV